MFSDLDWQQNPMAARRWGIALGLLLMIGVGAALVAPRTTPFTLGVVVAGFLVALVARKEIRWSARDVLGHVLPLLAFLAFAFASAIWAASPADTLTITGVAIVIALGTVVVLQCLGRETGPNLAHMGEGVWLAFLVGLAYILFEILTHQAIKVSIFNALGLQPEDLAHQERYRWREGRLIMIRVEDLTRNIAPATLFLWPVLLILRGVLAPVPALAVAALAFILCGTDVVMSVHGTSKVALVVSLFVYLCALIKPRFAARLLAVGWVVSCLAVVPLALLAYKWDLHNASWLEDSTRHRIIIWNYTAHQVADSPIIGIGARSTYTLGPQQEKVLRRAPGEEFRRTLSKHSHSIYMQTWLELGLVGAILLTLAGLAILGVLSTLPAATKPYALATFAAGAAMAASSYGMWQIWFVAMFGFTAVLLGLGVQLFRRRNAA